MELIIIEKKAFERMMRSFADFAGQVKALCGKNRNNEQWLNNEAVCRLLQISRRTLQTFRDTGTIPYSKIGRKCYYRASDLEQFINQSQTKQQED
jgi:predicted DNA-binding transcriptional regulator AlpA